MLPFVERAGKQANKLVSIIKNLLDVNRIQSGRIQIDKHEFMLSEVLNDVKEQNDLLAVAHTIVIKGDTEVKLCADRLKIEQVLSNLISNAVKYSPAADTIVITVTHSKHKVKVAVTDFGIGIAKDNLPFVYDRYFRIEKTSQNYPGLGLGLYISSQLIKLHNGETGVKSELGKGSTFWFTLPLE
jgi:signal transduction histidine kinase